MKNKPLYTCSISPDVRAEWMMKEYGSFEDHGEPETGHIYPLLRSMPKNKIVCYTQEELQMVAKSADYHTSWDSDDELVIRLIKKCGKICREINILNKK